MQTVPAPRPSVAVSDLERSIRREVAYAADVLRRFPSDKAIRDHVAQLEAEA